MRAIAPCFGYERGRLDFFLSLVHFLRSIVVVTRFGPSGSSQVSSSNLVRLAEVVAGVAAAAVPAGLDSRMRLVASLSSVNHEDPSIMSSRPRLAYLAVGEFRSPGPVERTRLGRTADRTSVVVASDTAVRDELRTPSVASVARPRSRLAVRSRQRRRLGRSGIRLEGQCPRPCQRESFVRRI